jgi:hypothetical protein
VDLGLDDAAPAEALGDVARLVRVVGDLAAGNRDAEFLEEGFGLVFVNFHQDAMVSGADDTGRYARAAEPAAALNVRPGTPRPPPGSPAHTFQPVSPRFQRVE